MAGPEFNEMTDDEIFNIIDDLQVLARSKPNDKHRLVTLLKQKNHVVAGLSSFSVSVYSFEQ